MKRLICFLLVLANATGLVMAQTSENLTRNVLMTIDGNEIIKPGEFQMELMKGALFDSKDETPWFSYIFLVTNRFTDKSNIFVNGHPKVVNRSVGLRPYKICPRFENCIFVIKNTGAAESDMGSNMEVVYANGCAHSVCDSVLEINDDGYVYLSQGICYYSPYKTQNSEKVRTIPVVWPVKKPGDFTYESAEGHKFSVFRDKYMPFSVLTVDGTPFELFDVYNEDNFRLKFSYDGRHWMAVGKECYWVDGVLKSVAGHTIVDFVINNDGHYGYTAQKLGGSGTGYFVVADGKIVRRNAKVCYFALNAEGQLKFRFVAGDRILQYENEVVSDVTDALVSTYFPDNRLNAAPVAVLSRDGSHKLTYQQGTDAVMIDDVTVATSLPCYAIFDERNSAFVWNAVENRDDKKELVIYRYKVKTSLFKKFN